MTRAPSSAGKTRLASHLSPPRLAALRTAMLADTLRALERLPDVSIFFTPDAAGDEIVAAVRAHGSVPATVVPQGGGDLGARMLRALQFLLRVSDTVAGQPQCLTPEAAFDAAILVGSDVPWLGADRVLEAAETLRSSGGVVLGPADDGGYYLIGMTEAHAGLFEGIAWGTGSVLTDTLRAAARAGVDAHLVRGTYDVDTIDDLHRLERELAAAPPGVCAEVRRWFRVGAA
jgi:glycosyltransferase A (GT-A) superfamily protein (DUF2064 family)